MRRKYDTAVFERMGLNSGIPVLVQRSAILPDERYQVSACLPFIGSCVDPADAPGTMHFFEHLPFQGTATYPSYEAIRGPIMSEGGQIGASTAVALTRFFVTGARRRIGADVAVLGDLIGTPLINPARVAHERAVIAQEYRGTVNRPRYVSNRLFRRWYYRNHPYEHPPIGELEVIQSMTPEALISAHRFHYHASNLALICTGDLPDDAELIGILDAAFGRLTKGAVVVTPSPTLPDERFHEAADPHLGDDHLLVLYPMPKPTRRTQSAWVALASCLGGSHAAPLGRLLRQELGLIYKSGGLAKFAIDSFGAAFQLKFHAQHRNFDEILRRTNDVLASLTASHWDAELQECQKKRPLCFMPPIDAETYAVDALMRRDDLLSFHETETLTDTITWEDVAACRRQLATIEPYIFRAIAR